MTDRQVEILFCGSGLVVLVALVGAVAPRMLPGALVAYFVAYVAGRKE